MSPIGRRRRYRPTLLQVAYLEPLSRHTLCVVRGIDADIYAGCYDHARRRLDVTIHPGLTLAGALAGRAYGRVEAITAAISIDASATNDDLVAAGRLTPGLAILAALHPNCHARMDLRTTTSEGVALNLMLEIWLALLRHGPAPAELR